MGDMTRIHPVAKERARTLRTAMSDAEKRLWRRLRKRQVGAYRFRRQHPLGRYIVDFVCLQARLVVEVDGGQHVERVHYDQKRSAWLGKHGFRVLRFWNHEVMNQTEAVMTVISEALHASVRPPSLPSPWAGGRNMRGYLSARASSLLRYARRSNCQDPQERKR